MIGNRKHSNKIKQRSSLNTIFHHFDKNKKQKLLNTVALITKKPLLRNCKKVAIGRHILVYSQRKGQ